MYTNTVSTQPAVTISIISRKARSRNGEVKQPVLPHSVMDSGTLWNPNPNPGKEVQGGFEGNHEQGLL